MTLDATWPVLGTDPFYLSTPQTMRIAFDLACRRSLACAAAAPGRSMERIAALAERLRRAPVVGRTREPGGPPATWTVDVGALVSMVNNAGADSGVYRDLDAAARAVLERDDGAPLLRLAAHTWNLDSGKVTARVTVKGPRGAAATLRMAWTDKRRHPLARVTGRAGGDRLAATLPAP